MVSSVDKELQGW